MTESTQYSSTCSGIFAVGPFVGVPQFAGTGCGSSDHPNAPLERHDSSVDKGAEEPAILYETAELALLKAIPELQTPFYRLITDWDNFGGGPPGQYSVFSQLLETWLEVLLAVPPDTKGRDDVLRRTMAFGERMLSSPDREAWELASESYVYPFVFACNRAVAEQFGGPELKAVLRQYHNSPIEDEPRDYIDLWGVREFLAPLLPDLTLPELPGISNPRDYDELGSLDEAKKAEDGVVLICDFGHTYVYLIARAEIVDASDADLQAAALELAPYFRFIREDGMSEQSEFRNPRARYLHLPHGERVWHKTSLGQPHGRFDSDLWISDNLNGFEEQIRDLLAERIRRLNLA